MQFRPCIDIHNGKVKQIIGASLRDAGDQAAENFVSGQDADYYASLYRSDGLSGGHIILLNPAGSDYYAATKAQALKALHAWPGGMQIGGGMNAENAESFLAEGASHVIVTSYVFSGGRIVWEHLEKLRSAVGKEHIVLDLSCRRRADAYYVVTDRWQKFTDVKLTSETLRMLEAYADEFLIHAADVEGRRHGIEEEVARILGAYDGVPVTYAGGIRSTEDIARLDEIGGGHVNFTVGSALDLFGGTLPYRMLSAFH